MLRINCCLFLTVWLKLTRKNNFAQKGISISTDLAKNRMGIKKEIIGAITACLIN